MNLPAIAPVYIHASVKRRKTTWYTTADGNWTNPYIWESNAVKRWSYPGKNIPTPIFPQVGDDVFINHNVAFTGNDFVPTNNFTYINNLYVSGTLTCSGTSVLTVNGDLQATGTIAQSGNSQIRLMGVNNSVVNYTGAGTIQYARSGDQYIMPLPYSILVTSGSGSKILPAQNLTTASSFTSGAGTTLVSNGFNLLTIGLFTINSNVSFTTNPNVEMRGGLNVAGFISTNMGTGTWSFTTNNQTCLINSGTGIACSFYNMVVAGSITVTHTSTGILGIDNSLDGTVAGSTWSNQGKIYFNTTNNAMVTAGTFNKDVVAANNIVGYVANASHTLQYLTYQGLYIAGTGTKLQASGTNTIGTTLTIAAGARLDSNGNTTVSGTTANSGTHNLLGFNWIFNAYSMPVAATFTKSSTGSIIFNGAFTNQFVNNNVIDFSGNPTIECRGGATLYLIGGSASFISGTNTWSFTTNNQTLSLGGGSTIPFNFNGNVIVSGAITVTFTGNNIMYINQLLDGTVAGSIWVNQASIYFNNASHPSGMDTTGVFDRTTSSNSIVGYVFNGAYTLPFTSYQGLVIGGTGSKTVSGNLTVSANLVIFGTFDPAGNNVSVTGACSIAGGGTFNKTASGNLLFVGLFSIGTTGTAAVVNFSGNPSIECRGGIDVWANTGTLGTGTITFTTNNQTVQPRTATSMPATGNILISGAITITWTINSTVTSILNGNNAASTFDNRATMNYQNATQPMATGVLQTNTAANTWIYNLAGAQDIKGGTYRTLTLAGSGVKTLQGNVVVATLYTLTPPATLNLNGFTRT